MTSIGEPIVLGMLFMIGFVFTALIYLFMSDRCKHNWNIINQWFLDKDTVAYKQQCSICKKTEIKHT